MGRRSSSAAFAVLASLALAAPAAADSRDPINGYRVKATPQNLEKLAMAGFDVTEGIRGRQVEIFGTAEQIAKLKADGISAKVVRDRKGRTAAQRQRAFYGARAAQAPVADDSAYQVWTRYDRVRNDGKEQYLEQYDRLLRQYPKITKELVLGRTHQGRDIIAIKVTRNADKTQGRQAPGGALQRPAARARVAGRRDLPAHARVLRDQLRRQRPRHAPGRQRASCGSCASRTRTATSTRSRPATACGARTWPTTTATACAASRATASTRTATSPPTGASTTRARRPTRRSETYRGPGPDSEPETKAMKRLWDRVDFTFQKNDHTAAELLLWPQGFQKFTPTPDNAIFETLAGHDHDSAIQDDEETFDPDLSSELYITNGDALDDAYRARHPRLHARGHRVARRPA